MVLRYRGRMDVIKLLAAGKLREMRDADMEPRESAESPGLTVGRELCHELLEEPGFEEWNWDEQQTSAN